MFSQLARYASQLDIEIEDAEMDIRMTYDTRGKLLLADVHPGCRELTYVSQDPKSSAVRESPRNVATDRERLPHDQFIEKSGSGGGKTGP
jgi:hypothetical protein